MSYTTNQVEPKAMAQLPTDTDRRKRRQLLVGMAGAAAGIAAAGVIEPLVNTRSSAQRQSPGRLHNLDFLAPYNPDAPPGPSFTKAQVQHQWRTGAAIRQKILAAFHAGKASVVVPPGDYRFSSHYNAGQHAFLLADLRRSINQPFHIKAHGATFWFPMSSPLPDYHLMVRLQNCSNLTIEGLTVDSAERGCMEGRIVKLDCASNQIIIKPLAGTRIISQPHSNDNNRFRFIPFKANGNGMPALYQIGRGWGPESDLFTRLEAKPDGSFALTLRTPQLLGTTRDPRWREVYGLANTLEVGDLISVLYSVAACFHIRDCERIKLVQCRSYAAKSIVSENGGFGAHEYIDCRFISRPGTNNLLGGEGPAMSNNLRHGSVHDGVVIGRTSDDPYNNHGHWKLSQSYTSDSITFTENMPAGLHVGDLVDVYRRRNPVLLTQRTIAEIKGNTLKFTRPVGLPPGLAQDDIAVLFPGLSNSGWVIRNSWFLNCYQRILIQCGPGRFENNRVIRMGDSLAIDTCYPDGIEGGNPSDLVIQNNVFFDCGLGPDISTISILGQTRPLHNITIAGNVFFRSGRQAIRALNGVNISICNNLFFDPGIGYALLPTRAPDRASAISLENVRGVTLKGNLLAGDTLPVHSDQGFVSMQATTHAHFSANMRRTFHVEKMRRHIENLFAESHPPASVILDRYGIKSHAKS